MVIKLLFVTLEFVDPIFSGNGVYSRSLVRILSQLPDLQILVVCGRDGSTPDSKNNVWGTETPNVDVVSVPVGVWRKLDRSSAWEQFAAIDSGVSERVRAFGPAGVIGVDWTSVGVYKSLQSISFAEKHAPFLYFNFRVFAASNGISAEDKLFYQAKEGEAVKLASSTGGTAVALAKLDAKHLESLHKPSAESCDANAESVEVLMPPLRHDVLTLAKSDASGDRRPGGGQSRKYITCCARLTPEKNVMHFVAAVSAIAPELQRAGLVPYLVGSPTDPAYAAAASAALKRAFPADGACIVSDFQPPAQLAEVFRQTALNVHPALYEAYGMTVAEAAAFGAPTLLDGGGSIGVAGLLPPPKYSFAANMSDVEETATTMKQILGIGSEDHTAAAAAAAGGGGGGGGGGKGEGGSTDGGAGVDNSDGKEGDLPVLLAVAEAARAKSLSWGEQQLGEALHGLLLGVFEEGR